MSSLDGSLILAFVCAANKISLFVAIACSRAWLDFSLPTNKGTTVDGNTTEYLDEDVVNGETYYYVVSAVYDGTIESSYSNEASATPMPFMAPIPQNLVATGGDSVVDLQWDQVEEGDGGDGGGGGGGDGSIGSECEGCTDQYNAGGPCILDCQLQCVNAATAYSWVGDGYCDDGSFGMY